MGSVSNGLISKEDCWKVKKKLFPKSVMVHKSINNKAPLDLSSLFSKFNSVHNHYIRTANLNLLPTHTRLNFGQKCFSHYHLWNKLDSWTSWTICFFHYHLWNKLDRDIQAIDCTENLKISLKNKFLFTDQGQRILNNNIFLTYVIL